MRSAQQRERPHQVVAALPGLDAADGEDEEPVDRADLGPPAGDDSSGRRRQRRSGPRRRRCSPPSRATPYSAASRSCHIRLTTRSWSGSRIERSWHSTSAGVVKSSTWWTVRTTLTGTPSSRRRTAARAEMQSCMWRIGGRSSPRPASRGDRRPARRRPPPPAPPASPRLAAPGRSGTGPTTGRKKPTAGSPRAMTSTRRRLAHERLAQGRGVHDATARLGRVGDERDASRSRARRLSTIDALRQAMAAAASAARAPVGATRRRPRRTGPLRGRGPGDRPPCRARRRRREVRPGPPPRRRPGPAATRGRGGSRTRAPRRAARRRRRLRRPDRRSTSSRASGSIIGCGRPLVYSSSPRSRQVWLPAGAGT